MTRIDPHIRKEPAAAPVKSGPPRLTKQRRKRMSRDEEYRTLAEIYLVENPQCVLCGGVASQVHHVCSGIAGRAASLLNSDTWLGVCANCHTTIEHYPKRIQRLLKQDQVREAMERLTTL